MHVLVNNIHCVNVNYLVNLCTYGFRRCFGATFSFLCFMNQLYVCWGYLTVIALLTTRRPFVVPFDHSSSSRRPLVVPLATRRPLVASFTVTLLFSPKWVDVRILFIQIFFN